MVSHPQTGGTALKDELGTIDCAFLHLKVDAVATFVENESSRLIAGA